MKLPPPRRIHRIQLLRKDVVYYAGSSRPGGKTLLNRQLEKAKKPVYNYLFAWASTL